MASASMASDPFYVARDEVSSTVHRIQRLYDDWKLIFESQNTAQNPRFGDLHSEILSELRQVEYDLQDIDATIGIVESNPEKFQLGHAEIATRKSFLTSIRQQISRMRDGLTSPATTAKLDRDKKAIQAEAEERRRARLGPQNEEFLRGQRHQVSMLEAHQDETLTDLAQCADRLGNTAALINHELEDQAAMLDQLDHDIDRETEKLNFVMKKMGKLLQTGDSKQLYTIFVLSCILLILFLLVVWT